MRLLVLAALIGTLLVPAGARADESVCTGTVTSGGPWVAFRSVTVLTDDDSVDGFFCALGSQHAGRTVAARAIANRSGSPYALSVNFHAAARSAFGRRWLGGCTGIAVGGNGFHPAADVPSCRVPAGATTVEVTAYYGALLDVDVLLRS